MTSKRQPPRNKRNASRKQRKQQHLLDVKVRSAAASRQRTRAVLAWLSAVLLFSAAVYGIAYGAREGMRRMVWQNPEYNLAEVRIHTDGPLTRDQILTAASIREGKNIFAINLSAARKGLLALPQIERAEIDRILPNKISIDITERKPVAWITGKDDADPAGDPGAFLIDRNGMLLRMKTQVSGYYHLPVVCGLPVDNYEEGQTLDQPEVKAALQLIRLTGDNPTHYQPRSIDVSRGYCMIVSDDRHTTVPFPLDNIESHLARLGIIFANADASHREIQTVNLLVDRNIPVTFAPLPDTNADAADPDASPTPAPVQSPTPSTPAARKVQFLSATGKSSHKTGSADHGAHTTSGSSHRYGTGSHHSYSSSSSTSPTTVRRAIPITSQTTQP